MSLREHLVRPTIVSDESPPNAAGNSCVKSSAASLSVKPSPARDAFPVPAGAQPRTAIASRGIILAVVVGLLGAAGLALGAGLAVSSGATVSNVSLAHAVVLTCKDDQLTVGGLGNSTAAGTAVLTVRVTNLSPHQCSLDGRPTVTFLDPSGRVVPVHEATLARVHRGRVFLVPQTDAMTAGFVITTGDDMERHALCTPVAALRVVLPSVSGSFSVVGMSSPGLTFSVCGHGYPAEVSAIATNGQIDGYALQYPACLASQLHESVTNGATSLAGTVLQVTVTNHTTATCTVEGYPAATMSSNSGPVVLAYQSGRGNPMLPTTAVARPVTLVDGASASAMLATSVLHPQSAPCDTWSALSIELPGDSGVLRVDRPFNICGDTAGDGAFVATS